MCVCVCVDCCRDVSIPFADWSSDQVVAWLSGIGLNMYVGDVKRWLRSGQQLLGATVYDLVKVSLKSRSRMLLKVIILMKICAQPLSILKCIFLQELGIRNHLHRKKLQLALQAVATNAQGLMHRLDYHWVTSKWNMTLRYRSELFNRQRNNVLFLTELLLSTGWLDDIGLPQYKHAFAEARVDGRMLHYMTAVGCTLF